MVGCLLSAAAAGRGRAVKAVGGERPCDAVRTCAHQQRDLDNVKARRCLRDARVRAPVRGQPSELTARSAPPPDTAGPARNDGKLLFRASRWAAGDTPRIL